MKIKKKVLGLGAVALLAVGLAACGGADDKDKGTIRKFNRSGR